MQAASLLADDLLRSQEGLCSISLCQLASYVVSVNEFIIAFRILLSVLNSLVTVCSVTILTSVTCQTAEYHNIITWAVVINIYNSYYGISFVIMKIIYVM
jgi:hypothetical protein